MELDRQSIEKRDFPIGRRGYDPAAVDAHLRTLAAEVEELRYALESRAGETLGSSAGTQVQGILEAAEATAAEIEQRAAEDARATREQAATDAERTRADAIARAQAHVAAVAQATAVLRRARGVDGRAVRRARERLRDGASRLATDLSAVETNMGELYDAASGRAGEAPGSRSPCELPARHRRRRARAAAARRSFAATRPRSAGTVPPAAFAPVPSPVAARRAPRPIRAAGGRGTATSTGRA